MVEQGVFSQPTQSQVQVFECLTSSSKASKWPFLSMKVGDMVSINGRDNFLNATWAYKYASKKKAFKFSRRAVDDSLIIKRVE